ncbi:MAG: hypothetical protein SOT46_01750 [Treponema sp.]|nr:hypothetical protein [Spirochaetia bacterium]MDY2839077.1 hypothetical protein [Treponema sp.]
MNYYDSFDWNTILNMNPPGKYDVKLYHKILCPEYPDFLDKYIQLPFLQRLKGIGLLCGTDWTKLYKNRFYYSRLDHSIGVALIIWNFTHNKAQTIAGLLHDVSTPVFSHVSDFRKGDALTQTATEAANEGLIQNNEDLKKLLEVDGLKISDVEDYHKYPVADNEIPCLSADRLEYMFPSGMALEGSWTLDEVQKVYADILVLKNEQNIEELGFNTVEIAELYCKKFCMTGHVLQLNENKLTLHLLGQIMNMAVELGVLKENDFMALSESEIIRKIENFIDKQIVAVPSVLYFARLYKTFRTMTRIIHCESELDKNEYFCVSLNVKQRYINPLVKTDSGIKRLNEVSSEIDNLLKDFLSFKDSLFGCVKLV